jgi:hypothetical protein
VPDVEGLLRRALAPVEPPEDLGTRVRTTLQSISDLAAEELEGWELSAMRDPRRWARRAVAAIAGGVAGTGLLVLGRQRRGRARDVPSTPDTPGADAAGERR